MISLIKKILRKIKRLLFPLQVTAEKIDVTYDQKRDIINFYRQKYGLEILVETGTFLGDTIFFFKDLFQRLYSIELSEELAKRAQERFKEDKNISIIQGDSANVLNELMHSFDKKALFWLDGHYSSEFFYQGEYIITAKADKNTPIEKELEILLASKFMNVILIDDARLFKGENDYPTIETIERKVNSSGRKYSVHVATDIIHILPKID